MKAIILEQYGHADELKVAEINPPELRETDVLVEVKATSVNPVDWQIREGYLAEMIPYEFPLVLGSDVAGVVKEVGPKASKFSVGDEVFGSPDMMRNGTYAELVAMDEIHLAKKPTNLTFEEAASVPLAGLTAWTSLVNVAHIQSGERVLVQGGAGGVGSLAIQIAKAKGCWVAATCSEMNVEFLHQLGVDQVINYEEDNFEDVLEPVDVVLETIGGEVQERSFKVLKKGGRMPSTTTAPDEDLAKEYGVKGFQVSADHSGEHLMKFANSLKRIVFVQSSAKSLI